MEMMRNLFTEICRNIEKSRKRNLEKLTKEQRKLGKFCLFKVYSKCDISPEGKYIPMCYRKGYTDCDEYKKLVLDRIYMI